MPKIAILTIGFHRYAVPPKVDAAKLLAALSQCERVDRGWQGSKEIYFPAAPDRHQGELTVAYVDARQLLPRDPNPSEDEGGPLRLEG